MSTTTPARTLEELEEVERAAMAQVAEARAAARVLHDQREARRTEAEVEHDRATLAAWKADRPELEADVVAARERLRQAVLADPTWQAYAAVIAASHRLVLRSAEASAVSARLGGRDWVPEHPPLPPDFAGLAAIVEQDATDRGRDEQQEREQRRVDVGNAAADEVGK